MAGSEAVLLDRFRVQLTKARTQLQRMMLRLKELTGPPLVYATVVQVESVKNDLAPTFGFGTYVRVLKSNRHQALIGLTGFVLSNEPEDTGEVLVGFDNGSRGFFGIGLADRSNSELELTQVNLGQGNILVALDGRLVELAQPAHLALEVGQGVLLSQKTQQIVKTIMMDSGGPLASIRRLIGTIRAEVDLNGQTQIVAIASGLTGLEPGHQVRLDPNGRVIVENLGFEDGRFAPKKFMPVTWDQVGGYEELKRELQEMLEETFDPAIAATIDESERVRGILFHGPGGTGKTKKVTVNAVATWTPGDVMIAKQKGGLVSLLSTRENIWQMPNVCIGIKKWNADNAEYVTKMIAAALAGGDQVMKYREARRAAADISAVVYNEETGDYWYKYYSVQTEVDPQGLTVELGGSKVNNLADNLYLFGLLPGSTNLLQATYEKYGNLVVKLYPDLVPSIDPASSVINPRYLRMLADRTEQMVPAEVPTFAAGSQIRDIVGKRSWNIEFETGSATFTPAAQAELNDLYQDLVLSGALAVQINGHTDDVGDPDANMSLSERRAFAVKEYLQNRSRSNFPDARVTVHAYGETQPLLPNSTSENRAKNRRVEIVVGKTS